MTAATLSLPRRLWSLAFGFPGLHALNMVLAIGFGLVQTLVFARVLPPELFSQTIAATAIAMYVLPLNQAVARANFVLLRERLVRDGSDDGTPETGAAFYLSQAVMLAIPIATPPLLGARDPATYLALACYIFTCTYTNVWVLEMQMTMLATGRILRFEWVNLSRRVLIFLTVFWLLWSRNFVLFTVLAAVQTAAYHLYGLLGGTGSARLFAWPRGLTAAAARQHGWRFMASLQATAAEWLVFNAPYALFTLRFGIGPGLVALDAVQKLVRVVVSVCRNLSEIALPRVSHAVFSGDGRQGTKAVAAVLLASGAGAAVVAAAALWQEHALFTLLLGPNNTVPAGAGGPAALAILSAVGFTIGGHLIGHTGGSRALRNFLLAPVAATALVAGVMLSVPVTVLQGLWAFGLSMAVISAASIVLLGRLVAAPPAKAPPCASP